MHCFSCGMDTIDESGICEVCGRSFDPDADRYFKAGMESLAAGDLESSVAFFDDCLSVDEDHMNGRFNLGLALALDNRCDESMDQYAILAEKCPEYPGLHTAMGQAAFGSYLYHRECMDSNCEAMIQHLRKAIQNDPDDVDAHFSLGNAYLAIGSSEQALLPLGIALELQPDSSAINYALARVHRMLGNYDTAVRLIATAAELAGFGDPLREEIQEFRMELQQESLPL